MKKQKKFKEFKHSKSLGQNFLQDEGIIDEIIEACGAKKTGIVLEVGPGEGALTERLVSEAGHVVAVELDKRLIPVLGKKFKNCENISIINDDILKIDIDETIGKIKSETNLDDAVIVGNLPYYITTPIIMKILEEKASIRHAVMMMQKEVGERLLAEAGEKSIGAITHSVNYYAEVKKVCDVDKTAFNPVPKVDSMVVKFIIRDKPPVKPQNEKIFFSLIKTSFLKRRKTLANSLNGFLGIEKKEIENVLSELEIDKNIRCERLTIEQFSTLSDKLLEKKENFKI